MKQLSLYSDIFLASAPFGIGPSQTRSVGPWRVVGVVVRFFGGEVGGVLGEH